MIVNLDIPTEGMNPAIFTKGTNQKHLKEEEIKQLSEYANAYAEWDKLKVGDAPAMPSFHYKPFQFSLELMKMVVRSTHKVGKTGHLRHIIRLIADIDDQAKLGTKELILTKDDINFIKNNYSKVDWPTQPDDLIKFIVLVEDALKTAKEK